MQKKIKVCQAKPSIPEANGKFTINQPLGQKFWHFSCNQYFSVHASIALIITLIKVIKEF